LRHVARDLLEEMDGTDDLVVRALPTSRDAASSTLEAQFRVGLRRVHKLMGSATGARP